MRVMFVGRQAQSMAAMEQALRDAGCHWHVPLAQTFNQAMAQLQRAPVDVVMVDLQAPGVDGGSLLRLVQAHYPQVIRVALAERPHAGAPLGVLDDTVHQYLPQSCDARAVAEMVRHTVALRDRLSSVELQRVIGQVERLPSAPRVYMQLRGLLGDPQVHAKALSDLLDRDPALTTKVLQLANSAYFTSGTAVTGVAQAVLRVGVDAMRLAVLANEVFDAHRGEAIAALRARAVFASQLAARIASGSDRESARTAALLSYAGGLVPGVEALCAAQAGHSARPPVPEDVGAYLLGLWGLPPLIVEAVAYHARPREVPQRRFGVLGTAHVAVALANGGEVDMAYLRDVGMAERWPRWQRMAQVLAAEAGGTPVD